MGLLTLGRGMRKKREVRPIMVASGLGPPGSCRESLCKCTYHERDMMVCMVKEGCRASGAITLE